MTVANFSSGDLPSMSEYFASPNRAVVQLGRTLEWGSRGRGFKSRQPEFFRILRPMYFKLADYVALHTAISLVLCASPVSGSDQHGKKTVTLNVVALKHAKQLIQQKRFIADHKGAWKEHRPSAADENEFIRIHGFAEYAKWHLGIDETHPAESKARYKFPFGDFKDVHRCALLAVKSRARQYGYTEIENAAALLIQMIPRDD
jgi:hypothetical protein